MKLRTTLILLIVLTLIGGAWWLTRGLGDAPATDPGVTDPKPIALFPQDTLDVAKIDCFEITRPGKDTAVFTRTRGRWQLTEPVVFGADASTVNQLLQSIAALRDLGPAQTDGRTASPIATVTLHGDGEPRQLYFQETVGGGLAIIRVGAAEPRLIDDILHGFFRRYDPVDLLSKQLATPNAYNTDSVIIYSREGETRLDHADGQWVLNEDPGQLALSEPVEGCIDVAGYLNIPNATKIEAFIPLSQSTTHPAAYGLDPASARIRIAYRYRTTDGQNRQTTLSIGAPVDAQGNSYYAMLSAPDQASAVVFVLSAEFSIVLAKEADDFRDPRVFSLLPIQAERIELLGVWSLPLTDERGNLLDPRRARPISLAALREALTPLLSARSRDYVSDWQNTGRWEPTARVRVTPTLGGEPELVTFYRQLLPDESADTEPGDERYLAVRDQESVGMLIATDVVDAILALRDLELPFEASVED